MTDLVVGVVPEEAALRAFLRRPAAQVAPDLLGWVLRRGEVAIRITEVEAYQGEEDPGSHAFRGPTPRTEVMFGPAGSWYVYFTYGMHWCVNLVCDEAGTAAAVLVRAGEVVEGRHTVAERRAGVSPRDWARGPARLTRCLDLDGGFSGTAAWRGSELTIEPGPAPDVIRTGPRVGVAGPGGDGDVFPWRFWADGEPSVSVYRPAVRRKRPPSRG